MRRKVTKERLKIFMHELAKAARSPGKVYFTGGTSMLLLGIRDQTVDVDLKLDPEPDGVFEALADLKNSLDINVELASPDHFIPVRSSWRERSRFIDKISCVEFLHYDFCMQALSKIERGHDQDLQDVIALVRTGYTKPEDIRQTFISIKKDIVRYPALDALEFERKISEFLHNLEEAPIE